MALAQIYQQQQKLEDFFTCLIAAGWMECHCLGGEVGGRIAILTETNEAEDGWAGSRSSVLGWTGNVSGDQSNIMVHLGKPSWTGSSLNVSIA